MLAQLVNKHSVTEGIKQFPLPPPPPPHHLWSPGWLVSSVEPPCLMSSPLFTPHPPASCSAVTDFNFWVMTHFSAADEFLSAPSGSPVRYWISLMVKPPDHDTSTTMFDREDLFFHLSNFLTTKCWEYFISSSLRLSLIAFPLCVVLTHPSAPNYQNMSFHKGLNSSRIRGLLFCFVTSLRWNRRAPVVTALPPCWLYFCVHVTLTSASPQESQTHLSEMKSISLSSSSPSLSLAPAVRWPTELDLRRTCKWHWNEGFWLGNIRKTASNYTLHRLDF